MMAEEVKAKESGTGVTDERSNGKETETATLDADIDGMTWEELAKDARDRLETCQMVSHPITLSSPPLSNTYSLSFTFTKNTRTNPSSNMYKS